MYIKSNFIPIETYIKLIGSNPKYSDKKISIFNDYTPTIEELSINPINILVIQEPNQLFGLHDWAIQNYQQFNCILTWGQDILNKCENALLLPFGTSFLDYENKHKYLASNKKYLEISFLCGAKNVIEGHKLRHSIYSQEQNIKPNKNWLYSHPHIDKYQLFETSMFHLAIENSKNQNFFTEKIIDAFITKTIPVYWGCPNIHEFFDTKGFFIFNTEEEFFNIVNNLTEKDYHSRKEYIEKNYQIAIYYADIFKRIEYILDEIIKLNNL